MTFTKDNQYKSYVYSLYLYLHYSHIMNFFKTQTILFSCSFHLNFKILQIYLIAKKLDRNKCPFHFSQLQKPFPR